MEESVLHQLVVELQRKIGRPPTLEELRFAGTVNGYPIGRLQALKLKMYQERGHPLPHIHIDLGRKHHVASYSIDPAKLLEGGLDARSDFVVLDWLTTNREILLTFWHSLQNGQPDFSLLVDLRAGPNNSFKPKPLRGSA